MDQLTTEDLFKRFLKDCEAQGNEPAVYTRLQICFEDVRVIHQPSGSRYSESGSRGS